MELKPLPVAKGSPGDFVPTCLPVRSRRILALLHAATVHRCEKIGRQVSLVEMMVQLAIRQAVNEQSTCAEEFAVMQTFLEEMCRARKRAFEEGWSIPPEGAMPRDSLLKLGLVYCDWPLVEGALWVCENLGSRQLKAFGQGYLTALWDRQDKGETFRKRVLALTGLARPVISRSADRPPRKGWEPVNPEMFARLFAELPSCGPELAYDSILAGRSPRSVTAQIFARAAWLTGMRPGEIGGCRVMDIRDGLDLTDDEIDGICRNPQRAEAEGRLVQRRHLGEADADAVFFNFFLPRFLFIEASKTNRSTRLFDNSVRVQILVNMHWGDLDWLVAASMLGSWCSKRGVVNARRGCAVRLRTASLKLFPERAEAITLQTLRRAFIEDARALMSEPEVAALTGLASPATVGERSCKGSQRRRECSRCWMPRPSPAAASEIAAAWKSNARERSAASGEDPSPMSLDEAKSRFAGIFDEDMS